MNKLTEHKPTFKSKSWDVSKEVWFAQVKKDYTSQVTNAVTAILAMQQYLNLEEEIVMSDKCWKTPTQWVDTSVRVTKEDIPSL
jgi:hypothetical protein